MPKHLQVRRFSPTSIKKNRVILITGKRGTGKTTLLKYLMYTISDRFDIAVGIGGSHASVEMLESFIPKALIYTTPDAEIVERMVEKAKILTEHGKRREILLILDDCTFRKDLFKKPVFREIFMNGRNFGLTFVISAQYIMDLHTDLRSQIDYVFTFREQIRANRKRLHEYFYGMVDDFHDFERILHTFTCDYECLVMDNTDPTGDIENQLFFYKAPLTTPPFTIGKGVYWMLDTQCQKNAMSPNGSQFYHQLAGTQSAASSPMQAIPSPKGMIISRQGANTRSVPPRY